MKRILILGSSGFIGSNLTDKLQKEGNYVIGVDMVEPKYHNPDTFYNRDLRYTGEDVFTETQFDQIYILSCLMGGMGFLGDEEKHGYEIGIGSMQIVLNCIEWITRWQKFNPIVFYSSSACVYNQELQKSSEVVALKESDAIPASPDLLYGWQKLYSEFCFVASGLDVRIARFHNIFGKWGTWEGGKEKAPAAMCRKVAKAKDGDLIEVWGTGEQTRSFMHIDECLEAVERLMASDYKKPINIGSDELTTINHLAEMVIDISGKNLGIKNVDGIVGVQGRNSDNTLCEKVLGGWRPTRLLYDGLCETYDWINEQVLKQDFYSDLKG